jgi:lactoylglutathione lyase
MRTLFAAYRVSDLERSVAFYTAVGYRQLGQVVLDDGGRLALLSCPGESAATLELVHRPEGERVVVGGFDHLAVAVDVLEDAVAALARHGLPSPTIELPGGPDGPRTATVVDPDGYRIELVEWPPGHPVGITAADFPPVG